MTLISTRIEIAKYKGAVTLFIINKLIGPQSLSRELTYVYKYISMTSLLTHIVEHSTRPFFMLEANNQLLKKFLSLAVRCRSGQMSKSCQKWQNSDFQSQFSMSKIIQIFLKICFIEEYDFRGTLFVIDIFWKLQFLNTLFSKMTSNFWKLLLNWWQDLKTF